MSMINAASGVKTQNTKNIFRHNSKQQVNVDEVIDYDDLINGDTTPISGGFGHNRRRGICSKICGCFKSSEDKYKIKEYEENNYLDLTNENDYTDYPELKAMSADERE